MDPLRIPDARFSVGDARVDRLHEDIVRCFREIAEQLDQAQSAITPAVVSGLSDFHYALDTRPFATRVVDFGLAWCLQTPTPYLAFNCYASDKVIICERVDGRWRPLASGSVTLSGFTEVSVTDPMDIIYVPSGSGTHRGKFWVCSSASDTITTIDPFNSFATATFTLGVAEANIKQLVYDASNDKVWALTAATSATTPFDATRIARVNPGTGANEAQATPAGGGLTAIVPTASKIWYSKTSGLNTARVQYLDPSTLANTNPGIAVGGGVYGLALCEEIDRLCVIEGNSTNTIRFWDVTNDTEESSINTGVAQNSYRCAYIHGGGDKRQLWLGGVSTPMVLDVIAGSTLARSPIAQLGSGGALGWWDSYYIPEYAELLFKEVFGGTSNYWWVYPSI